MAMKQKHTRFRVTRATVMVTTISATIKEYFTRPRRYIELLGSMHDGDVLDEPTVIVWDLINSASRVSSFANLWGIQ